MSKCVIFAPIAEREIKFYAAFAQHARKQNWPFEIQFISFFQAGNAYLRELNFKVWDVYEYAEREGEFKVPKEKLEAVFGFENLHKHILHEKLTFGISNNEVIYDKYRKYLNGLELILAEVGKSFSPAEITVFQELGGFVGPLSLLYVCKSHKVKHIFFEPAFFRGMMNFVEDSFISSFKGLSRITEPKSEKAVEYLRNVRTQKSLVIPQKDRHHYKDMGLSKLFNLSNFTKLFKKLYLKYVKGEKQEYEHIFNHVLRNVVQYFNRLQTGKLYSEQLPQDEFIYFPFHVRLDVQLTIRNPEYLNQLAFVEYVAQVLPARFKLVIKEHPASIGGFSPGELKRILRQNENIVLLQPMMNTYEVLDRAHAVITVNSKVGAEALSLGKRVACMGHGFYWNSEIVHKFSSNVELREWLEKLSRNEIAANSVDDIEKYFSEIYRQSYPFELYNHSDANLGGFYKSLYERIML